MRRVLASVAFPLITAAVATVGVLGGPRAARAQDDGVPVDTAAPSAADPGVEAPPSTLPLVPVPSGCVAPIQPDVVFVGTLVEHDFRTGRFQIERVRAGDPAAFQVDGLIDVRYGLDTEYLDRGEEYLVSARRDPVLGVLASRVTPAVPDFGGDDVIGIEESDVTCPRFDDPVRTLHTDGSVVESGVFAPLFAEKTKLIGAFLVPLGVGAAVIFVLAMLRISVTGVAVGVGNAARRRRR